VIGKGSTKASVRSMRLSPGESFFAFTGLEPA